MCLIFPYRVISKKNNNAVVSLGGEKQKISSNLVKIKKGDYVLVQNNTIIKKIDKKMAQECLDLFKKGD